MKNPGTLTIRGGDILQPPLLVTDEAKVLEFRDKNGDLLCFWIRVFDDGSDRELWGFCARNDPDWKEMCVRYGYAEPSPGTTMKDVLKG